MGRVRRPALRPAGARRGAGTECLADVVTRLLPYWYDAIVPDLRAGETVLVAAHGNSLRALVKHLDGLSEEEVVGLNIPTAQPLRYELDDALQPGPRRRVPRPRGRRGRRGCCRRAGPVGPLRESTGRSSPPSGGSAGVQDRRPRADP